MPEQTDETAAFAVLNNSKNIDRAKAILMARRYPIGLFFALGIGSFLIITGIPKAGDPHWIKAILSGSVLLVLIGLIEQLFANRRLEAAIQLLLSHQQKLHSYPGPETPSNFSA
jgi:hypothetical protein